MNIASIDIGTNTVLLLIAGVDFSTKKFKILYTEQIIPRIGEKLTPGSSIRFEKQKILLRILKTFKDLSISYKCDEILITATNAFRIASNTNELVKKINDTLDLKVRVISGEEEAKFTFWGCAWGKDPTKKILVIDIGGGSTEFAFGMSEAVSLIKSIPIGAVNLSEKYFNSLPPNASAVKRCSEEIRLALNQNIKVMNYADEIIAAAGTPTTLACIKNNLDQYNEIDVEGEILTLSEVQNFKNLLSELSADQVLERFKPIVTGRQDVLLAGTILLFEIMNFLNINEISISARGVRYGAIVNYLNNFL